MTFYPPEEQSKTNINSMVITTEDFHCLTDVKCIPSFFHLFFFFPPHFVSRVLKSLFKYILRSIYNSGNGGGSRSQGAGPDGRWLTIDLEQVGTYFA